MQIGSSSILGQGATGVFAGAGQAQGGGDFLMGLFALLGIGQGNVAASAQAGLGADAQGLLNSSALSNNATNGLLYSADTNMHMNALSLAEDALKAHTNQQMSDKEYNDMLSNPAILQLLAALGINRDHIPLLQPAITTEGTTNAVLDGGVKSVHLNGATDEMHNSLLQAASYKGQLADVAELLNKADKRQFESELAAQGFTLVTPTSTNDNNVENSTAGQSPATLLDQLLAQVNRGGTTQAVELDAANRAQLEAWQADGTLERFINKLKDVVFDHASAGNAPIDPSKSFTAIAQALQGKGDGAIQLPNMVATVKLAKTGQKTVTTEPVAALNTQQAAQVAPKDDSKITTEGKKSDEHTHSSHQSSNEEIEGWNDWKQVVDRAVHGDNNWRVALGHHGKDGIKGANAMSDEADVPVFQGNGALLPIDQVRIHTTKALNEGLQHIKIELNPAELGRVDVQMEFSKDGKTSITIMADRVETLDMLRKDSSILQQAISSTGASDGSNLQFSLRDGGAGQQQQQQQRSYEQFGQHGWSQADEEEDNLAIIQSYVGRVVSNDHIDIQV